MDTHALFSGYHVLLTDESRTRLELFDKWLSGIPTRTATTVEEFDAQLDTQTVVGCISRSLFGEDETTARQQILAQNPYSQLVLFLPHGTPSTFAAAEYDAWLSRPVYRQALQSTIIAQLKYGVYSHTLHEFYTLNAQLARSRASPLEQHRPKPATTKTLARYQELQIRLDGLQSIIDTPDIDAILRSLKRHHQLLQEPIEDTPHRTPASKYHPNHCPHCKLPWGINHRNNLGIGYERVGAHVWRCTRCHELTHGLGSSHRRIHR